MKKYLILSTLIVFMTALTVQAQHTVGYLNPQEVLDQLPERDAIERQLNNWLDEKEVEFEELALDFQRQLRIFEQEADDLTDSQLQSRQRELQRLNQQLEEFQFRVERDLERRQAELLQPILQEIDLIVEEVAREKGLTYVLNQATAEGELLLIHVAQSARDLDLTPIVIERLLN